MSAVQIVPLLNKFIIVFSVSLAYLLAPHQTRPVFFPPASTDAVLLFVFSECSYQVKQCAAFYNISAEQVAEAVAQTNEYYGGYDIRSSRIVFPNGSIDPWHALGITQDITAELPAVFIKGKNQQIPLTRRKITVPTPSLL